MRESKDETGFSASPWRMGLLAILGVAMTSLSCFVWWRGLAPPGSLKELAVFVGVPFFGLCTAIAIKRMLSRAELVTVSRQGIRDTRYAADLVPWSAVRGMQIGAMQGQRFLTLELDAGVERSLRRTLIARWSAGANAALGFAGMTISMTGLDGTLDDLVAAIDRLAPVAEINVDP